MFSSFRPSKRNALKGALLVWLLLAIVHQTHSAAVPANQGNPHWDVNRCDACHVMLAGKAQPISSKSGDGLCLKCHDGKAASSEVHPIGLSTAMGQNRVPDGWPLVSGQLGCLTCHDMKRACGDARKPFYGTNMLRTFRVGSEEQSICLACHPAAQSQRFNPHIMLTADRKVVGERCLTCHTEVLDPTIKQRTGAPKLRGESGDELALCRSCHPKHKDQFSPGHVGALIKPDMLAFMRAREVVGLMDQPKRELIAQIKSKEIKLTHMLPAADGTIICTTCHNPHQAGLFAIGTPMAYRPMKLVDGTRIVSPVRGEVWCSHCHSQN
jgi:predicted CXXCH cytochrome family protein